MKNTIAKNPAAPIRMALSVYEAIRVTIGTNRAETGGMLGGDSNGNITHFYHDENASRSAATYSPDTQTLNRLLTESWNPAGIRLLGFAHSHPPRYFQPSGGDEVYAARILAHNDEMPFLALPIIQSANDVGNFQIRMFVARREGAGISMQRVPLIIVEDEDEALAEAHSRLSKPQKKAKRLKRQSVSSRLPNPRHRKHHRRRRWKKHTLTFPLRTNH